MYEIYNSNKRPVPLLSMGDNKISERCVFYTVYKYLGVGVGLTDDNRLEHDFEAES